MKIYSFYRDAGQLKTMQVEVGFLPGLPKFQIMGLPDSVIRESQVRIKSALKAQGFSFPLRQQVLVNLQPVSERKSGYGVDLAIAVAFLLQQGQIEGERFQAEKLYVCGDLSLKGDVVVPDSFLKTIRLSQGSVLLTGAGQELVCDSYQVSALQELLRPEVVQGQALSVPNCPEPGREYAFDEPEAELLAVVALGGHSLFLAGPAGSGKTTLAECLYFLLPELKASDWRDILRSAYLFSERVHWRPIVTPHHTITPQAMVGGGSPIFPGAIVRAHGGLLILDEFLEFAPRVQEALREPLEKGVVKVFRRGRYKEFPARSQVVATSNLCPCGDYIPGRPTQCFRSLTRCRSYLEKINGPLLDRFAILHFTKHKKTKVSVSLQEVKERVEKARGFQKEKLNFDGVREFQSEKELWGDFKEWHQLGLLPELAKSKRRALSFLRVARSFADLDLKEKVELEHMNKALNLCLSPFEELKRFQ